jgi:serine/threonine protein kinase
MKEVLALARQLVGRIKAADFVASRGFVGAMLYAAPEQLAGGEVGPWTDVYSLGLLLFDLLCGRTPTVDGARRAARLREVLQLVRAGGVVEEVSHHGSDRRLQPMLEDLVEMTAADPRDRRLALRSL